MDLKFDRFVTATGSAGTHAGLVAGFAALSVDIPILGFGVRAPKAKQEENVFNLAVATAETIGAAGRVKREMVVANCDYVGEGYGLVDQGVIDALALAAETEGLLFDPVYSGKALKGLIDQAGKGAFKGERVVFLHTGGAQGLFGYQSCWSPRSDEQGFGRPLAAWVRRRPWTSWRSSRPPRRSSASRTTCGCWSTSIPRCRTATSRVGPRSRAGGHGDRACAMAGPEVLAIACNTAHAYAEEVRASGLPLVDMLETAGLAAQAKGATIVGVLGTSMALSLYRDRFSHMGLEVVMLDDHEQVEFMALLYRIKQGDVGPASRETMAALAHRLVGKGAQSVVAGCTEVPLVRPTAFAPTCTTPRTSST
jgi:hypothetical protein